MAKRTKEKKPLCVVEAQCAHCGKLNRVKVHRQRTNPKIQPEYEYSTDIEPLPLLNWMDAGEVKDE